MHMQWLEHLVFGHHVLLDQLQYTLTLILQVSVTFME